MRIKTKGRQGHSWVGRNQGCSAVVFLFFALTIQMKYDQLARRLEGKIDKLSVEYNSDAHITKLHIPVKIIDIVKKPRFDFT